MRLYPTCLPPEATNQANRGIKITIEPSDHGVDDVLGASLVDLGGAALPVADLGFESRVCLTNKFNMSVYTIQQHSYKILQQFAIQNRIEHRPKYYGHTMTN